jgi:hypothetical protein
MKPFFSESAQARATARRHDLTRAKVRPVARHAMGRIAPLAGASQPVKRSAPPLVSTQTDVLAAFSGASQANDITQHGGDQAVAPPDTDIAVGPADVVDTVNSTIEVRSRTGAILGSDDLNTFLSIFSGYYSTDPRIIYDAGSQRWWLTDTEAPNAFTCPMVGAPVLIAVSASSNPLPFTNWIVYELPFVTPGTVLGDQPGLGISTNTVAASFNDYDCSGGFIGSDVDILQKTDLEHNSGANANVPFSGGPFSPQPVQSFGSTTTQYVVANDSDCGSVLCPSPAVEVDAFTGTPEGGNVAVAQTLPAMLPTAVDSTGNLPPAQQSGTSTTIQTDDDRFLNAVWENGVIWTAGGTQCTPTGDSALRSCLDYVGVTASSTGVVNPTITQINNVGVSGRYLYYPAVSVDAAGDVFTVFGESSSSTFPTIMSSTIPSGGSTLSAFQLVHASSGFYDPSTVEVCPVIASTTACRWGDYSGAAQDPTNPKDVWVVSEAEDGATSSPDCVQAFLCWGSGIAQLTLASPVITSLYTASGPVAGGATVTAYGTDFGLDTTATFNAAPIAITGRTATSFTFATPPSATLAGGTAQVQATDALGASAESAASLYTYIGLANYTPVTPFRIVDTRNTGGPIGQGLVRTLQVTGVGTSPIPASASAVVLNVTEVSGSASSLLTIYPYNTLRPTASNLNFAAHTVIANLVTVTLGASGGQGFINIYNGLGSVNVLVDAEGYFTTTPATTFQGLFHPISPVRVCDTRTSCQGHVAVGSGQSIVVTVASTGGVPADGTAEAAVVNLTGVAGNASTYLSLFPTNSSGNCIPTGTSTMNLLPGAVRANRVMVELGPASVGGLDDALCVYNAVGTINVLVDVNGWYGSSTAGASPTGYQYQALGPTRICDTRIVSTSCVAGGIGAGGLQRLITVAGHAGVPAFGSATTVVAIIANLTAIAPTTATYLTLFPANQTGPGGVSDLNLGAGAVLPNLAVVEVDTVTGDPHDGEVYLYNGAGSVNAIIDLEGWFQ